jgi:hypothetical protein
VTANFNFMGGTERGQRWCDRYVRAAWMCLCLCSGEAKVFLFFSDKGTCLFY